MGKYIKLFNYESEYQSFINSDELVSPNICFIEQENNLHFTPIKNDIIEYHFEMTMNRTSDGEIGMPDFMFGRIISDFSDLFNKIVEFAEKFGTEEYGYYYCSQEILAGKVLITINGYNVTGIVVDLNLGEISLENNGKTSLYYNTDALLYETEITWKQPL